MCPLEYSCPLRWALNTSFSEALNTQTVSTGDEQEQDRRRGGSEKSLTVSISRVSPGVLQKNKEDVQTPATGQSWKLSSTAFLVLQLKPLVVIRSLVGENKTRQQTT